MRADGMPTYFLADIAYHYHKFQRGFEHAIDFWGPDHHGYIQRMQGAMQALDISSDWLEVQILQQVTFLEDGKNIEMSKRKGQFVTMDAAHGRGGRRCGQVHLPDAQAQFAPGFRPGPGQGAVERESRLLRQVRPCADLLAAAQGRRAKCQGDRTLGRRPC